jgi:hypothetical protein
MTRSLACCWELSITRSRPALISDSRPLWPKSAKPDDARMEKTRINRDHDASQALNLSRTGGPGVKASSMSQVNILSMRQGRGLTKCAGRMRRHHLVLASHTSSARRGEAVPGQRSRPIEQWHRRDHELTRQPQPDPDRYRQTSSQNEHPIPYIVRQSKVIVSSALQSHLFRYQKMRQCSPSWRHRDGPARSSSKLNQTAIKPSRTAP